MALWKLTPIDLLDPNWETSSHRAAAVVRAPSETAARQAAQEAFGVKAGFKPGAGVRVPPWTRDALVKAERIEDQRYDADGPTEVLQPSF